MSRIRQRILYVIVFGIILAGFLPVTLVVSNNQIGDLHLASSDSSPVRVDVVPVDLLPKLKWPLIRANNSWNVVEAVDIRVVDLCEQGSTCIFIHDRRHAEVPCGYPPNRISGCAIYTELDGNHIKRVDVWLDVANMNGASAEIKQALVCHEIGHGLGLDHSDIDGSCLRSGRWFPAPSSHDLDTLEAITHFNGE